MENDLVEKTSVNTNYFGKPYTSVKTYMHVKSNIRRYLNTGGFYCLCVSQHYDSAMIKFLQDHFNYQDIHKIPYWKLPMILHNKVEKKDYHDTVSLLLFSNNLTKREELQRTFSSYINSLPNNANLPVPTFTMYSSDLCKPEEQSSLTSSFFDVKEEKKNHLSTSKTVGWFPEGEVVHIELNNLKKLSDEQMKHVFIVMPEYLELHYFYDGFIRWTSQESEIFEAVVGEVN